MEKCSDGTSKGADTFILSKRMTLTRCKKINMFLRLEHLICNVAMSRNGGMSTMNLSLQQHLILLCHLQS
jgi:hypothetical protein